MHWYRNHAGVHYLNLLWYGIKTITIILNDEPDRIEHCLVGSRCIVFVEPGFDIAGYSIAKTPVKLNAANTLIYECGEILGTYNIRELKGCF